MFLSGIPLLKAMELHFHHTGKKQTIVDYCCTMLDFYNIDMSKLMYYKKQISERFVLLPYYYFFSTPCPQFTRTQTTTQTVNRENATARTEGENQFRQRSVIIVCTLM